VTLSMYTYDGVGLQGGTFSTRGGSFRSTHPVATWRLDHVRWVRDVAVTGTIRWYRHSGLVRAHVHVTGPGAQPSDLTLRWNDLDRHPRALAQGVAGGQRVRFVFPAP
jgi:hypothetical protein